MLVTFRVPIRTIARYWLPVVLWMCVIFDASTDSLSDRQTSRFIVPVLRWLKPDISDMAIHQIHTVIRKGAHVTEYAVLALFLCRAYRYTIASPANRGRFRGMAFCSVSLSVLYAASDEFHQSFSSSRYASVGDVLIDGAGAILGVALFWGATRWNKPVRAG